MENAEQTTPATPAEAETVVAETLTSVPSHDPFAAKLTEIADAHETVRRLEREYELMIMSSIAGGDAS